MRTLTYSEKKKLSLVFEAKKIRQFLIGGECIIYNDRKPLLGLFGQEDKQIYQ